MVKKFRSMWMRLSEEGALHSREIASSPLAFQGPLNRSS
jgi:hypothetical protein